MINTTKGMMDEALLEKRLGNAETATETSEWVEYWLDGELVHRSVHVVLKPPMAAQSDVGRFY